MTHGAIFLALKTEGEIRVRANKLAGQVGLVAAVLAVLFGVWTQLAHSNNTVVCAVFLPVVVLAWVGALAANRLGREGWAFIASAITMLGVVSFLFACLFPNVMPSCTNADATLTIRNASTEYTLTIMTWVAVILTPVVLVYQSWTYWVFRKRLSPSQIPNPEHGGARPPARGQRRVTCRGWPARSTRGCCATRRGVRTPARSGRCVVAASPPHSS